MESSCSVEKRGEGKGERSLEAATNSLPSSCDLSLHPDVHDWTQRQAELHHGQGKKCWILSCSPWSSPAPQGSLAGGADWGRKEAFKCPADNVEEGKLCLNPHEVWTVFYFTRT